MTPTAAYAAFDATSPFRPWTLERRDVGPRDVAIEILHCGVCHSDLHTARSEWGEPARPCVPGHEIVGRVTAVGAEVQGRAVGDTVGVGCIVDSCRQCVPCRDGEEQFCAQGMTGTYGGVEKETGRPTYGGYSKAIVVDDRYVLRIPEGMDPAAASPLLCAGITTYSPLRHWKVGPGSKVGVVGLGGLGHMALKLAKAMGAEVTLFTTSPGKEADARRLGADHVVLSRDEAAVAAQAGVFDFILNTVAAPHPLDPLIAALNRNGTMVLVGAPASPHPALGVFSLIMGRKSLAGSLIGGIAETQEMLDFCAEHGIVSDIETIRMDQIDEAYERMLTGDVKYRFVIDMSTLPAA